jgi:hypothetical protein
VSLGCSSSVDVNPIVTSTGTFSSAGIASSFLIFFSSRY